MTISLVGPWALLEVLSATSIKTASYVLCMSPSVPCTISGTCKTCNKCWPPRLDRTIAVWKRGCDHIRTRRENIELNLIVLVPREERSTMCELVTTRP